METEYSKTGQPAAAFWERLNILNQFDPEVVTQIRNAGRDMAGAVGNEDIVSAFALALTASQQTGPCRTLSEELSDDDDPTGQFYKEMIYAFPTR